MHGGAQRALDVVDEVVADLGAAIVPRAPAVDRAGVRRPLAHVIDHVVLDVVFVAVEEDAGVRCVVDVVVRDDVAVAGLVIAGWTGR